jgi:hypothetical protein
VKRLRSLPLVRIAHDLPSESELLESGDCLAARVEGCFDAAQAVDAELGERVVCHDSRNQIRLSRHPAALVRGREDPLALKWQMLLIENVTCWSRKVWIAPS